jgi:BirA family transcriptional regulator, biotin operon repressor / biotin---[acetyl-CoA-carboxylase] ligase
MLFCNFNANLSLLKKTEAKNDSIYFKSLLTMIIGSNLLFFKNLPSTNSYASDLMKHDRLTEGTIIYTNHQSAGKGYSGNVWESEDNKNLLISVVIFPSFVRPANQFVISMAISLGICDFLMRFIPECSIKWPNDIYVKNDKIAGILIENTLIDDRIEFSIAGIGLNINQNKFYSDAPNPVSLSQLTGTEYDLGKCLNQLASDLDRRYKQLIADSTDLNKDYIAKLYRLNKWTKFRDVNGAFSGKILTISDYGRLRIELKNGVQREYSFKEIEFIL